jgi:Ca-activated chloride channel family protein
MRRQNNKYDLVYPITVVLFILSVWPALSRANPDSLTSPDELHSGGLLFRMQQGYVVATKLNTDINIEANGLVARVSVKQSFRNDGQEWVEGVYVFPLPDSAAVDRMRLHIGERFIEGEIREKEQARKEYEAARSEGKKASLVNQQRANLFTTSIANIAPGETVVVEIEYQQTVNYDEGVFSLRFPLTMTPRYIPGVPTGDRKGSGWAADTTKVPDASLITPPFVTRSANHKVTLQARISAGVPLDFVASRYHPVDVDKDGEQYSLRFAERDVPMDHDLELIWRPIAASAPRALLFTEEHESNTHLLLMLVPPEDTNASTPDVPRELILVIDTSGSMHGTSIEQARQAVLLALAGLRPSDRFNVIQFDSVTHALFRNSVDASASRIRQAESYVRSLQADGGTEMRPALQKALRSDFDDNYLRQIIFVTDGSVGNEEGLFQLIDSELGAARLFTVGIGSAPNGWFMTKAAEAGRGTYTFISALHEVSEKMARLFRKLEQPQVTSVDIQWPKGTVVDAYPAVVPDLYSGEPVVIKARLERKPHNGDEVIIRGDAVHGEWQAVMPLDTERDSAGIAALWARARIADLETRRRRGEDAEKMRAEIVTTAISHHLVSRYTSLIAVDKTPVRPASETLAKDQVPNLLPHGQSQQAILGFAATATSAPLSRMLGATFLILAMFVWLGLIMRHDHAPVARS